MKGVPGEIKKKPEISRPSATDGKEKDLLKGFQRKRKDSTESNQGQGHLSRLRFRKTKLKCPPISSERQRIALFQSSGQKREKIDQKYHERREEIKRKVRREGQRTPRRKPRKKVVIMKEVLPYQKDARKSSSSQRKTNSNMTRLRRAGKGERTAARGYQEAPTHRKASKTSDR